MLPGWRGPALVAALACAGGCAVFDAEVDLFAEPHAVDLGIVDPFQAAELPPQAVLAVANVGEVATEVTAITVDEAFADWFTIALDRGLPATLSPGEVLEVTLVLDGLPLDDSVLGSWQVPVEISGDGEVFASLGCEGASEVQLDAAHASVFVTVANLCDADFDGYLALDCGGDDCDDGNPLVHPDADELCNGFDDDCSGLPDDLPDADLDGYTLCDGDCNDDDAAVHPFADELCDGVDTDCDGQLPDDELDLDADTFPECAGDCDDLAPDVFPGALELCDGVDNDCNGVIDDGVFDDLDADGWDVCEGDCDDTAADTFPGAAEICDGADNDCDGAVPADEIDADNDGALACADCDDADATRFPGAPELCDGLDNDCDGLLGDDELTDADNDGAVACVDCDDADDTVFPGAPEICDGQDNDCDGAVPPDEALDADNDGFVACLDCDDGDPAVNPDAAEVCDGVDDDCDGVLFPGEEIDDDGDLWLACEDCDDTDPFVNPGAVERCNGVDDDCDGEIDNGTDVDQDGDGVSACDGDCDDGNPTIFPGATEECDYLDQDCDGLIDEGFKVAGRYVQDEHCGTCGNDCTQAGFDNAVGYCNAVPNLPVCAYECLDGFFDVNGLATDGCECEFISDIDEPFDGIDADCDGFDGLPTDAVYVSAVVGSPTGSGTVSDPLDRVNDGIDLATVLGAEFVIVSAGTYPEDVQLVPGINVIGGWDFAFLERDPVLFESTISGSGAGPAVLAVGIDVPTAFDGFTVVGRHAGTPSSEAVAMWVQDATSALEIRHNLLIAGPGRDGRDGDQVSPAPDGTRGPNGVPGATGGYADCLALPDGGGGGANACPTNNGSLVSVSGGDGGGANCPVAFALQPDGLNGSGPTAGSGGAGACDSYIGSDTECDECFIDLCWDDGTDGTHGGDGGDGAGGLGGDLPRGQFTSILASGWRPSHGGNGGAGGHGSGGGGGGTGSGTEVFDCGTPSHMGGTGGGGGAGGCGGGAGTGGRGGGGSLGLVLFDLDPGDLPVLADNEIVSDDGGDGGNGGGGGLGGRGGNGGDGGDNDRTTGWCAESGGDGGNGGDGGEGGGGGGGAGGPSFALYAAGFVPPSGYADGTTLIHGDGGAAGFGGSGGTGSGSDGTAGVPGAQGAQNW